MRSRPASLWWKVGFEDRFALVRVAQGLYVSQYVLAADLVVQGERLGLARQDPIFASLFDSNPAIEWHLY